MEGGRIEDGGWKMEDGRIEDGRPQSSILYPPSSILHPPSSTLHPPSSILHPPSSILHPPSSILHPPSSILHPPSSILYPLSSILRPPSLPRAEAHILGKLAQQRPRQEPRLHLQYAAVTDPGSQDRMRDLGRHPALEGRQHGSPPGIGQGHR